MNPSRAALVAAAAAALVLAGACGDNGGDSGGVVTITLAGPNQWNTNPSSFGPEWEKLVADFQRQESKIKVKTVVLPGGEFANTLATQLAAGTAPELVFNQAPHKPHMVTPLDEYLEKPNPYVAGNTKWLDLFNPKYYSRAVGSKEKVINEEGHFEFIPFNLVGVGVFYNKAAFAKAGIGTPPTTWAQLMTACGALRQAGYTPFAMDGSELGVGWTTTIISNMLFAKYHGRLNKYAADGSPGRNAVLSTKDWSRAILSGEADATKMPEAAESLRLQKEFFDTCATKDWSGVTGSQGALVGAQEFTSGKAAMAIGVNFSYALLKNAKLDVGSMPFPTITSETTPLAAGQPAQFGVAPGGTSYMIPSTVKGEKRDAAIKFLQFVSAPRHIKEWLDSTGGIPALKDLQPAESTKGFLEGSWGESAVASMPMGPTGTTIRSVLDGYLLGSRNLDQQAQVLQENWVKTAKQHVKDNPDWADEPWAKK